MFRYFELKKTSFVKNKNYNLLKNKNNFFIKVNYHSLKKSEINNEFFENLKLPVVDDLYFYMKEKLSKKEISYFRSTAVFGLQHLYYSNIYSYLRLKSLGIKHFFLMGKPYSNFLTEMEIKRINKTGIHILDEKIRSSYNYQEAFGRLVEKNWRIFLEEIKKDKKIEQILIIDEGAHALNYLPNSTKLHYRIRCVEQTTRGIRNGYFLPGIMVSVATSAAKRLLESSFIAEDVIRKIDKKIKDHSIDLPENPVFGVIGNGAIGRAIIKYIVKNFKRPLYVYDKNPEAYKNIGSDKVIRSHSLEFILRNTDCIFGCVGEDILKGVSEKHFPPKIIFISTSSEDKEYKTLINYYPIKNFINEENLLNDIHITLPEDHQKITILNGGYPINFNQQPEEIDALDIQLTRALMFGGCVQAILANPENNYDHSEIQQLHPTIQQWIVQKWKPSQKNKKMYEKNTWNIFNSLEKITKANADFTKSETVENETIKKLFTVEKSSKYSFKK